MATGKDFHSFEAFMRDSFRSVLAIRLVLAIRDRVSARLPERLDADRLTIPVMAAISAIPVLIDVLLYPLGQASTGAALWLVVGLAALNFCLLLFPYASWTHLAKAAPTVDAVLGCDDNRQRLVAWWQARLSMRTQGALSAAGLLLGVAVAAVAQPVAGRHAQLHLAAFLSAGLAGGLGLNSCYWLWMTPLLLRYLGTLPGLKIRWYSPADTPGLRELSKVLMGGAWRAAMGIVLTISPLIYVYRETAHPGSVVVLFNAAVAALSLATLTIIAAAPQYWLYRLISDHRERALDALDVHLPGPPEPRNMTIAEIRHLESTLAIYSSVANSKVSLLGSDVIAQYAAAAMTLAVPFVIQLVAHYIK